jgi:class 3 adenylate cyclase/Tfp pilus assembly protein PilF
MRKTISILACCVLLPFLGWTQDMDALKSLWAQNAIEMPDSSRFRLLLLIAAEHLGSHADSATFYCEQARILAPRTGRPADVGEVEGWLGYLAEERGGRAEATAHYRRALDVCIAVNDRKGTATILNNLAAIYKDLGLLDSALTMHRQALQIRTAMADSVGMATSHNNMGLLSFDSGRIAEAVEHYDLAVDIYTRVKDNEGLAITLLNMAGVHRMMKDYPQARANIERALKLAEGEGDLGVMGTARSNMGSVYREQMDYRRAAVEYREAYRFYQQGKDPYGMAHALRYMASVDMERGLPDSALMHANEAYFMFRDVDDPRGQAAALTVRGRAQLKVGRTDEAEKDGVEALRLARQINYRPETRDAAELLSHIYRQKGNHQKALEMNDLYIALRDSLLQVDYQAAALGSKFKDQYALKEAELRAEQEKKEALSAAELRRHRLMRNGSLAGFAVMLLFAGVFLVQRRRIEREKARSEELLLNILPEQTATELKETGKAAARRFDDVTVLFTDFKGFTELSERLRPEELVAEINECFSAFDRICERHGLEKIKTIGDSYMAACGLPAPCADHAQRAVRAALEMRDFMARRDEGNEATASLQIRIGLHSGPVVAGIVGIRKFQYDIWGDTVNTASRMESSSEPSKVNISEATYQLVKDHFACTYRGEIEAKGKGKLGMYFVE